MRLVFTYGKAALSNLSIKQFFYSAAILAAVPQSAGAEILVEPWQPIFQGIEYATGTADTSEPRVQKVNALRVDLSDPEIQFFSTPANGDAPLETFAQTTTDFLVTSGVQVAVNANFFAPCCVAAPETKDLIDLAVSKGEVVSPPESTLPQNILPGSLLITRDNRVEIGTTGLTDNLSNIFTAVSGRPRLLSDGEILVDFEPANDFAGPNPRTAVGLSQDQQYLTLITIDGRQPGFSEGATLYETAQWLSRFGSFQGLNLDGGGSTTLVREDESGNPQVLNSPSGQQRFNGNNFGVFAKTLPTPVPEPQAPLALFAASIYTWMNLRKKHHV